MLFRIVGTGLPPDANQGLKRKAGSEIRRNLTELSGNILLNQKTKIMSLRGAKRRGNPFSLSLFERHDPKGRICAEVTATP